MAFKIVRNDITKMNTEAIVNTANDHATVGSGCDSAVYKAAGYDELLAYRTEEIGFVPKEDGMRIAVDEINAFLLNNEMDIFLVVFDDKAKSLGKRIYPELEEYIDQNYVEDKREEEYGEGFFGRSDYANEEYIPMASVAAPKPADFGSIFKKEKKESVPELDECAMMTPMEDLGDFDEAYDYDFDFETEHESKLEERMRHISDTFSQYLMYLIRDKKMENADVYKRAIVDKKIFSKIKNNVDYHPQKLTALCLCVGAKLNLDESRDLLARAGYALSPCDKTDIIFSYFIENEIYDMIELDIQLEEHGLPCIIS